MAMPPIPLPPQANNANRKPRDLVGKTEGRQLRAPPPLIPASLGEATSLIPDPAWQETNFSYYDPQTGEVTGHGTTQAHVVDQMVELGQPMIKGYVDPDEYRIDPTTRTIVAKDD